MFLFFPILPIVIPLLIWVLNKRNNIFIDEQSKEALNFQLSCYLYWLTLWSLNELQRFFCRAGYQKFMGAICPILKRP